MLISHSEPGTVFVISNFSDLVTTYATNGALRRLEKGGDIRQIMRGIYERSKYSEKKELAPSADAMARTIARNYGWTIIPSGVNALNMLACLRRFPLHGNMSAMVYIKPIARGMLRLSSKMRRIRRYRTCLIKRL